MPLPTRAALAAEALTTTLQIANEWWRDRALRALAPLLPPAQLPAVLNAARALPTPGTRARSLARLAAALPGEAGLAGEALALGQSLNDPAETARVAVLAMAALPEVRRGPVARAALPGAALIADPWERAAALAELTAHLPLAERPAALPALRAIEDGGARASGLAALSGRLPEHLADAVLDEALAAAQGLAAADDRARALASLAEGLGPDTAAVAVNAALKAAHESGDSLLWARVVRWTSHRLPPEALPALAARVLELAAPEAQAEALPALAARLAEPLRGQAVRAALEAASELADEWARVAALSTLAPTAAEAALPLAVALTDPWARADALSALAAHLPPEPQAAARAAAVAAARACAQPWPRARALTTIAGRLPVDS